VLDLLTDVVVPVKIMKAGVFSDGIAIGPRGFVYQNILETIDMKEGLNVEARNSKRGDP
jgi:hypothetical protein